MNDLFTIRIESKLSASAAQVWSHAATMAGVNHELMPLVRMTAPARFRELGIDQWLDANPGLAEPKRVIFRSWILLGGVLPYDLHFFGLERVEPGRAFYENSSSLFMRVWKHERIVEADGPDGCIVSDVVRFAPRLFPLGYLVLPVFRLVFAHRHRRLRKKFN